MPVVVVLSTHRHDWLQLFLVADQTGERGPLAVDLPPGRAVIPSRKQLACARLIGEHEAGPGFEHHHVRKRTGVARDVDGLPAFSQISRTLELSRSVDDEKVVTPGRGVDSWTQGSERWRQLTERRLRVVHRARRRDEGIASVAAL